MGPLIREAQVADLDALHALIERAYRGEEARDTWANEAGLIGGPRTSRANLAAIIADPRQSLLVAERDGRLIGCVEISDMGGGLAYLGLLTVDPGLQQAGLGKQLLALGEQAAAATFGTTRIEMTVVAPRTTLIAYYQRRGYAITGEMRPFPPVDGAIFLQGVAPSMVVLEKPLRGMGGG